MRVNEGDGPVYGADSGAPGIEESAPAARGWWIRGRIIAVVAGVVVLALVVGGAAFALAGQGDAPVADPTPTATPSDEPSAEPEPVVPVSRFAIDCEQLAPAALRDALLPGAMPDVAPPFDAASARQAGFLLCTWRAGEHILTVTAVPDAPFDGHGESPLGILDDAGDGSWRECMEWDGRVWCEAEVWVADAWIRIWVDADATRSEVEQGERLVPLMKHIADVVVAGPAGSWTAPDTRFSRESLAGEGIAAIMGAALGLPGIRDHYGDIGAPTWWEALTRTGSALWRGTTSDAYVEVTILPGGAWAADEFARDGFDGLEVVDVTGADVALVVEHTGELSVQLTKGWIGVLAVDSSFIQVLRAQSDGPISKAEFVAQLAELVKTLP